MTNTNAGDRRMNVRARAVIDAAVRVQTLWGTTRAWNYARAYQIDAQTLLRIFSAGQPRRSPCPVPVEHELQVALDILDQRGSIDSYKAKPFLTSCPRTDRLTAYACDRAISLLDTHGRAFSMALLRLYHVKTPTILRVLDSDTRRPASQPFTGASSFTPTIRAS